ncbi:MAG: DnaJ domain-containing protein, partial [Halobacteria archaeon]|nr:DnaJ domain-containing protein [Halobacteria archaeon]
MNYYAILGVETDATQEEIKEAYREKAREYHPDASEDDDAEEKFKRVQEAYDVLSDEEKRRAYDRKMGYTARYDTGNAGGSRERSGTGLGSDSEEKTSEKDWTAEDEQAEASGDEGRYTKVVNAALVVLLFTTVAFAGSTYYFYSQTQDLENKVDSLNMKLEETRDS